MALRGSATMKSEHKNRIPVFPFITVILLSFVLQEPAASAFQLKDIVSIGAAYSTHLFLHETGHQAVAHKVGAESSKMHFFTNKKGNFYPGVSTYEDIPEESKLPYAVAGDQMAGNTFEYALKSYRNKPTTYNKALMFFSCMDFFVYTLLSNYINTEADMYDPNLVREETDFSKEALLSVVTVKTLINTYRMMNPDFKVAPVIWVDKTSAALLLCFPF
ncbi:MAG: hypothetical protein BBJ60_07595 [Desulfobacterales bacterium S7086C20]|nr:MAG: hypothetical protein BBJ60_07595 [Desulfobacterales bacterium S7086C20]